MCYLIAKKHSERGCIAVKTESGKALVALVTYLGLKTLDKGCLHPRRSWGNISHIILFLRSRNLSLQFLTCANRNESLLWFS